MCSLLNPVPGLVLSNLDQINAGINEFISNHFNREPQFFFYSFYIILLKNQCFRKDKAWFASQCYSLERAEQDIFIHSLSKGEGDSCKRCHLKKGEWRLLWWFRVKTLSFHSKGACVRSLVREPRSDMLHHQNRRGNG